MKVLFTPEVRKYFRELEDVLFTEEYFGFEESAIQYVSELIYDIEENLPTKIKRKAPPFFNQYGLNMEYASFRKNKATEWYAFFTKYMLQGEIILLVRYISNNHKIAKYLKH